MAQYLTYFDVERVLTTYEKKKETRAFKGTFYMTKKSCTDRGNPKKKKI